MAAKPKLIILTGATAAGKSAFIYEHLRDLPLTIINADSRQVYAGITIASASPAAAELSLFPHALYNFLPMTESFSAGAFMRAAKAEIDQAVRAGRIPLVCGGTYFYLHALLYGLLPAIDIPETIRHEVESLMADEAYARLTEIDPDAARQNHTNNQVRVKRALMLCLAHNGPISALEKAGGIHDDFDILMLIFDMDRAVLRNRTAERVKQMFAAGLVAEIDWVVKAALAEGHMHTWRQVPALTGIGIREFFEIYELTQKSPSQLATDELARVEHEIAQNTIHLVKRQQTWYKNASPKPGHTKTVDPSYENGRIAALVREFVG